MQPIAYDTALIVGAGSGLSASLARAFAQAGLKVALAARSVAKLDALVRETGGKAYACDAVERDQVVQLFGAVAADMGTPDVVVYNASYRQRGALIDLDPAEVEKSLMVSADGGFRSGRRPEPAERPDSMLDPDAIAATYLHVLQQPRSAWTWEVELRPWVEKF